MSEELAKIDKPEAKQFEGKRKLYLVPLVYSFEGAPEEYTEKYSRYWKQVNQHLLNLESKMGSVNLIYHESVTIDGDKGLEIMKKLNSLSCEIAKDRCQSGAKLVVVEDADLTEETMDWERHLMVGFISNKVARTVSEFFSEASRKRYEYISNRINETLGKNETAILFIRENHRVQFPHDIEVFSVIPPALDEINRWVRERYQTEVEPEEKPDNDTEHKHEESGV